MNSPEPSIELSYDGKTIFIPRVGGSGSLAQYIWSLYKDKGLNGEQVAEKINAKGFRNSLNKPWGRTSASDLCARYLGHTLTGQVKPRKSKGATPAEAGVEGVAAATLEMVEYALTLMELEPTARLEMVRRLIA